MPITRDQRQLPRSLYDGIKEVLNEFHSDIANEASASTKIIHVAKKYRDRILNQQESASICAYAISAVIESREVHHNGDAREDFRRLALQAQKCCRDFKLEEERRRLRALAVLWGQWSVARMTHYKWECHSPKLLSDLAKVAMRFPQWSDFVRNLNCVLILRHEKSLGGGRSQRIGYHHQLSAVQDVSSPLEACDVEMLLAKPPTPAERERTLERVENWTRNKYDQIEVDGKTIESYSNIAHFDIVFDQYGMLVREPKSVLCASRKRNTLHLQIVRPLQKVEVGRLHIMMHNSKRGKYTKG